MGPTQDQHGRFWEHRMKTTVHGSPVPTGITGARVLTCSPARPPTHRVPPRVPPSLPASRTKVWGGRIQVWTRHCAPPGPAFTRPSLLPQFIHVRLAIDCSVGPMSCCLSSRAGARGLGYWVLGIIAIPCWSPLPSGRARSCRWGGGGGQASALAAAELADKPQGLGSVGEMGKWLQMGGIGGKWGEL